MTPGSVYLGLEYCPTIAAEMVQFWRRSENNPRFQAARLGQTVQHVLKREDWSFHLSIAYWALPYTGIAGNLH